MSSSSESLSLVQEAQSILRFFGLSDQWYNLSVLYPLLRDNPNATLSEKYGYIDQLFEKQDCTMEVYKPDAI